MKLTKLSLALVMLSMPLATSADELEKAKAIEGNTTKAAAQSQKRINSSSESTLKMRAEIEQLQDQIKNLTIYRDHLNTMVEHQGKEAESLHLQIEEIKETRQGVVPLMYRMLDSLTVWVENDTPIKHEQRMERVLKLGDLMGRADVTDAEKFRRILEAYQVEIDYGTKLGAYQGKITADGDSREVDVLHLGRVSLVARSLDGQNYWYWSNADQQWQGVDSAAGVDIDTAFAIAGKQVAPSLISLPVSANQEATQ